MEEEYSDIADTTFGEFEKVVKQYDLNCEKEGMFDAYHGTLPQMPDNEFYMKGYNSVKQSF